MGDEDHPSRFEEEYTHEVIMEAVREAPAPVAIASGVAERAGCSRQTARRKLGEMHEAGQLHRFDAGPAVLWWPREANSEDADPEVQTDGGVPACPVCDAPVKNIDRFAPDDPLNPRNDGQDVLRLAHRIVEGNVVTDYCDVAAGDIDAAVLDRVVD